MEESSGRLTSPLHCADCGTPLAHDQRYCIACGTRRGPLPGQIAWVIGAIRERGGGVPAAGRLDRGIRNAHADGNGHHPYWYDAWAQAPRAAAAAVLSMLGFGAAVGALVGGGVANPLQTLLVAGAPAPVSASLAGGAGAQDAGGSQGPETITEQATITQPGSAPASSGGSGNGSSGGTTGTSTPTTPSNANLPPIKHVFVITLSNQGFQQTFGHPQDDLYLGRTLVKQGLLIPNYYAVAGGQLANEVAMVSGQGPTPQTVEDCPVYTKIVPGKKGPNGQVLGDGCVYPKFAQTLVGQLAAAKLTWKVYLQTAGRAAGGAARARADAAGPWQHRIKTRTAATTADVKTELCRPKLSSQAAVPTAEDPYAAWRNPFLYFDSVVGSTACPKDNVPLGQLARDLKTVGSTPSLSWIVADTCADGDAAGNCPQGRPIGMAAADAFLTSVVPEILSSPAYKNDGMIAITFDQAPQTGPTADPSSCCNTPTYPNDPNPDPGRAVPTTPSTPTPTTVTTSADTTTTDSTSTATGTTPATPSLGAGQTSPTGGGGQVGMLILSKYVAKDQQDTTDYFNHFSLLASIEELFGLKRLGYANSLGVITFGPAVFSKYAPGS